MSDTLPRRASADVAAPPAVAAASGPAFPPAVKVLATVLVGALLIAGATSASDLPKAGWLAAAVVAVVIAAGYWRILASRTSCDSHRIEETGPWRRSVEIADITRVMLVRVRGLEGLVVPRLVVRTKHGLTTFHTADPSVLARFEALAGGARQD